MNRRRFLEKISLGLALAGLGGKTTGRAGSSSQDASRIIYRTLGKTGLRLPAVSFGVMNSDSSALILRAMDLGIRHFDTAFLYLRGNSERVIGQVVDQRKNRAEVIISTKMRFNRDSKTNEFLLAGAENQPGATAENLYAQLETSLGRLRTEYVDILYLHSCYSPAMALYEPLMNALVQVKKEGKARFIGVSTHRDEPNVIRAAADSGIYDVVQTAYNYAQDHREQVKEAIAYATRKGVGVVAMKTQGGAALQREAKIKIDHSAALKWVLQDENVSTTIPGMTTFDQLEQNIRTMSDLSMALGEHRNLEEARTHARDVYCQNCRACIPTCPNQVEIPKLVRAYMYARGYGNEIQARDTIDELPPAVGLPACRECVSCSARCVRGIDIGRRIAALSAGGL